MDPRKYVLEVAACSPCENRKVGCILVSIDNVVVGEGFNHSSIGDKCEDAAGATETHVVHAEVAAIDQYMSLSTPEATVLYVTHNPCPNCLSYIREQLDISIQIIVVESFMKFDSDKLRYDLVLEEWHRGDAEILTFGAKKYKPNNWKENDDIGRYIGALERHLAAVKQAIETGDPEKLFDEETGLHHMKHLRCNAGFILHFTKSKATFKSFQKKGLFKYLENK